MKSYEVGTGIGKARGERKRIGYHQMSIKRHLSDRTDALYQGRANGEIGHEVAIHDIQVQ